MKNSKRVLVACEYSGRVRDAFRKRGFDAWSCDLLPTESRDKQHHIQGDVLNWMTPIWDLIIAHPPCTYLCNSGVCWLNGSKGDRTKKNYSLGQARVRWAKMKLACEFFNAIRSNGCPHIAVENPIPHCYARDGGKDYKGIGKYTQIIQPWMFGHPETKATCLWLKNLPLLIPTKKVNVLSDKKKRMRLHYLPPSADRWKIRSMTYQGIADAMAKQWGDYILKT